MPDVEGKGWFGQHLFRNCLTAGIIAGGAAGWLIGRNTADELFTTLLGVFGGFFVGFLAAMFMSD